MARIALFSTYAPSEEFGGPARLFHERRALEAAGHQTTHVVVDAGGPRGALRRTDLRVTVPPDRRRGFDPIYHDVDLGEAASADGQLTSRVIDHLTAFRTTHVLLEQPFLARLVEAAVARFDARVIYSSQNIEYALRRSLEQFAPLPGRRRDHHEDVRALEQLAVDMASVVTVICPQDGERMLAEFGSVATLVPNGSTVSELPLPGARRAGRDAPNHFAFAGSAYWPNVLGLRSIATPSLAFLPPDTGIDVAGTVSRSLQEDAVLARHHGANFSRLRLHGFLPMDALVALLSSSVAVLVPVFMGEGSNLKTADALASGAPVIMTARSAHGYMDVIDLDDEGVTIVDTPGEFRHAMKRQLHTEGPDHWVGLRRREALSWMRRLADLPAVVDRAASVGQ